MEFTAYSDSAKKRPNPRHGRSHYPMYCPQSHGMVTQPSGTAMRAKSRMAKWAEVSN